MTEEENLPAQLQVPPEPLIDENQFDPESHYNTRKRKYVYASQTSDKGSITDSQISNWSQTSEFLWHREVHVLIINLVIKSSLYRILQTYAASKRTSLQGLDNIAADENDTFTRLEEMIEELHNKGSTCMSNEQPKFCKNKLSAAKHVLSSVKIQERKLTVSNHGSDACLEETYSLNNQLRPITTGYPKGPQASADFNNHGVCNEIPAIKVSRKTE
ncbi:unnamed protein product [Mytilus edulis]|uniref:Uncharacterized protein n=1 Tax=Mytilus edulis TaxID=6550 RepID=A0A8S3UGU5_MYTED|nr:unnamed protein product [Mytilus edulis]